MPSWAHAGPDGTFGNRWDDCNGVYRVLYAADTRLGAFVEVLARFRPDLHVEAELAQIEGDDDGAEGPGALDVAWLENRCIGSAAVPGDFVDVGTSGSLARIRSALAAAVIQHGLDDLDAAAIRLSAPRRLTQKISTHLSECSTPGSEAGGGCAGKERQPGTAVSTCAPSLLATHQHQGELEKASPGKGPFCLDLSLLVGMYSIGGDEKGAC